MKPKHTSFLNATSQEIRPFSGTIHHNHPLRRPWGEWHSGGTLRFPMISHLPWKVCWSFSEAKPYHPCNVFFLTGTNTPAAREDQHGQVHNHQDCCRWPNARGVNFLWSFASNYPPKLRYPWYPPKIDGWKMKFPFQMVPFQGTFVHFAGEVHTATELPKQGFPSPGILKSWACKKSG